MTQTTFYLAAVLVTLSLGAYGCNFSATNEPSTSNPPAQTNADDAHAEHGDHAEHGEHADHGADGMSDMEMMKAELAKLSPEDAASAEKQHFCLVSGKMLGTMGPPQKVDVNGQQVWICCAHCKDELPAKPDEYLARLKKE